MSQVPPADAGKYSAEELIELERQENNLVFHLQTIFLESDYEGFDRANEELSEVREKIYTLFLTKDIDTASDNERHST